jgi:hypothetical protein
MQIYQTFVKCGRNMNVKYLVLVAVMAVMLIGTAAFVTEDAFADKKKRDGYEKSQAVAQTNYCGNGEWSTNVGCQNTASEIQGDDNAVKLETEQEFEEERPCPNCPV